MLLELAVKRNRVVSIDQIKKLKFESLCTRAAGDSIVSQKDVQTNPKKVKMTEITAVIDTVLRRQCKLWGNPRAMDLDKCMSPCGFFVESSGSEIKAWRFHLGFEAWSHN